MPGNPFCDPLRALWGKKPVSLRGCLSVTSSALECRVLIWGRSRLKDSPIRGFELIEEGPGWFYEVAGHLSPESGFAENLPCSFHLHGNELRALALCYLQMKEDPDPWGLPQAQRI